MAALASALGKLDDQQKTTEAILQADELGLALGERTQLQEQLLQVYGDFAGIRFQNREELVTDSEEPVYQASNQDHDALRGAEMDTGIDLNRASFEGLQEIPHLGPERAGEVMAMRPITDLDQLAEIDGIGPKRLQDIKLKITALN